MFLKKIGISITKLILPLLHKALQFLKTNTRAINFLNEKRIASNNSYNFQSNIEKLLKNKKIIGLDVGAQGGSKRHICGCIIISYRRFYSTTTSSKGCNIYITT